MISHPKTLTKAEVIIQIRRRLGADNARMFTDDNAIWTHAADAGMMLYPYIYVARTVPIAEVGSGMMIVNGAVPTTVADIALILGENDTAIRDWYLLPPVPGVSKLWTLQQTGGVNAVCECLVGPTADGTGEATQADIVFDELYYEACVIKCLDARNIERIGYDVGKPNTSLNVTDADTISQVIRSRTELLYKRLTDVAMPRLSETMNISQFVGRVQVKRQPAQDDRPVYTPVPRTRGYR